MFAQPAAGADFWEHFDVAKKILSIPPPSKLKKCAEGGGIESVMYGS